MTKIRVIWFCVKKINNNSNFKKEKEKEKKKFFALLKTARNLNKNGTIPIALKIIQISFQTCAFADLYSYFTPSGRVQFGIPSNPKDMSFLHKQCIFILTITLQFLLINDLKLDCIYCTCINISRLCQYRPVLLANNWHPPRKWIYSCKFL